MHSNKNFLRDDIQVLQTLIKLPILWSQIPLRVQDKKKYTAFI